MPGIVSATYTGVNVTRSIQRVHGSGLYRGGRFYAATGRYSLVNTCNTWIAEARRRGGCLITPVWAVTAGNLLLQAERCGQVMRR